MTADDLLAEAGRLGVTLTIKGDRIRCHPKGRMTTALRAQLRVHKAELLDLLDELDRWPDGRPGWVDRIMAGPEAKMVEPEGGRGYREHLARIGRFAAPRAEPCESEAAGSSLLDTTKPTQPRGGPDRAVDTASMPEKIQAEPS